QLLAGRPGQYRQMQIGGLREAERALEVTLRGDAVEQIPPADNRRHPLIAVVDHDREVVGRQAVPAPDHVVAVAGHGRGLEAPLQRVVEPGPRAVYAHAHRRIARGDSERAAGARIAGRTVVRGRERPQLAARAAAPEREPAPQQREAGVRIRLEPAALAQAAAVPAELEGFERAQDVVRGSGDLPRWIDVLDADEPLPAGL